MSRIENDQMQLLPEEQAEVEEHHEYLGPQLTLVGWVVFAAITVLLALFIRLTLLQTFKIPSSSMYPTLHIGDHIVVNKIAYGMHFPLFNEPLIEGVEPQLGDVVVFQGWKAARQSGGEYFVKRIVAVPGDIVEVHNYRVFVNGKIVTSDTSLYEQQRDRTAIDRIKEYPPLQLGKNEYFVLGDNRLNSEDSRTYGPITRDSIAGRAAFVYWSWVRVNGSLEISLGRIGKGIR